MRYLLFMFILLSGQAGAEPLALDKFVVVTMPENLDLTYQALDESKPDEKFIVGWKGEDFLYSITTKELPSSPDTKAYWKATKKEFKKKSDNKRLEVMYEGEYKTNAGLTVTYKLLGYLENGVVETPMINLVKDENVAYWIIVWPADQNNLKTVLSEGIEIIRTAELTKS